MFLTHAYCYHTTSLSVKQVATPDPNKLKTYVFCLWIWLVQVKPSLLLNERARHNLLTAKQPNSSFPGLHYCDADWTLSSVCQTWPRRQKKLLEHFVPPSSTVLLWSPNHHPHKVDMCSNLETPMQEASFLFPDKFKQNKGWAPQNCFTAKLTKSA